MALAIAPNKRELKNLMRWQKRDRGFSRGLSLEEAIRHYQSNHNVRDGRTYVITFPANIPALTNHVNGRLTDAELKAHNQDAAEFNQWYNGRGIDNVVENTHRNIFRKAFDKVYDSAAQMVRYTLMPMAYLAKNAFSSLPPQAKRGLVIGSYSIQVTGTSGALSPQFAVIDAKIRISFLNRLICQN